MSWARGLRPRLLELFGAVISSHRKGEESEEMKHGTTGERA